MSWVMRDFECECGCVFEDIVDKREAQESECPECGRVCAYIPISPTPIATFSLQDSDDRRRTMLKRSADHTLKEIKREPEKHGDVGVKIAREGSIRSK